MTPKEDRPCCAALEDPEGRLPIGWCGPDCQGRSEWLEHVAELRRVFAGRGGGGQRYAGSVVEQVATLRAAGLTQRAVADLLGMSHQHVSRIDRGESRVTT